MIQKHFFVSLTIKTSKNIKSVKYIFCSFSSKFQRKSANFQLADFQTVEKRPIFGKNFFN